MTTSFGEPATKSANGGVWSWSASTDELLMREYGFQSSIGDFVQIGGHSSTLAAALHPEDVLHVRTVFQKGLQDSTPFEIEYRVQTQPDSWKWVLAHGQVTERDENGKPSRTSGVYRDLSNSPSSIQPVLASSAELARLILSNISDAVLVTDQTGEFRFICPNVHVIFGYSDQEVAQMQRIDRLIKHDLLEHYRHANVAELSNLELTVEDKSGNIHILLTNIKSIALLDGTILFTFRDITDLKRAETISYQANAKARQYLDIAEVIMVALNQSAEVTMLNRKGCDLMGCTEEEIIGANWIDTFIPEEHREQTAREFQDTLAGRLTAFEYYENELVTSKGERRYFAWHTALLYGSSDIVIGMLSSGEDITERRQAEAALRERTKSLRLQTEYAERINQQLQHLLKKNRRAHRALAENEAMLSSLINNVDDSIFSIDTNKCIVSFNTAFASRAKKRYGITIYRGMVLADAFPRPIVDIYFPLFDRALAGESVLESRRISIPEAEVDIYNEITCNPIYAPAGKVTGVATFVHDVTRNKLAEIALRESEARFRQVVENVPLSFHIYDHKRSEFVYSNQLFDWLFRYVTGSDALNLRDWEQHIHPEERPSITAVQDSDAARTPSDHEYRVVFPSGFTRYLRQITFALAKDEENPVQIATFTEDVTERKHMEQTLRQNERLLDSVINHALNGIAAFWAIRDASGRIVDFEYRLANPGMAHLFGQTPNEMIGRRLSHNAPRVLSDGLFEQYVQVVETGNILDTEYHGNFSPAEDYFRISGAKLDDGLVVTFANITAQKKNQLALIQNRALLASILETLPIGVIVTSLEGRILSVNNQASALLRQHSEGMLERNIADFIDESELALWNRNNAIILQTGQSLQGEFREFLRGSGSTHLVNCFLLRDENEVVFGIGRIMVDITEQKQIQEQLREASRQIVEVQERERRHIARELHDEVGQSLTGVLLMLNHLGRLDTANAATINEIQLLIRQLMGQIRELSHNLHPPILDKQGLFAALRWYCDHYLAQTQIRVDFKFTGEQARFSSEIELTCFRIVQESLTNIARYARVSEAAVVISVTTKRIRIFVSDDGVGFDVEATASRDTTFGLFSMRERVLLLGGWIDIRSVIGQGTRISVRVPLLTEEIQ